MTIASFGGPMFEHANSGPWKSVTGKDGGHYNNYGCLDKDGMAALREFFPDGIGGELNFVLFSTSGVHGTYSTIEDAEAQFATRQYEDGSPIEYDPQVTFLIVQPRICTLRHGNCIPRSTEDFAFLKQLRATSWAAVQEIGRPELGEVPK